jgi:hypothetical protein
MFVESRRLPGISAAGLVGQLDSGVDARLDSGAASVVAIATDEARGANLSGCYILAGLPKRLFGNPFGLTSICPVGLCRAAIKIGAFLNSQSLMMNISYDMRLRLKHHVAALNWPLHFTVHNHLLGSNASDNPTLRRNNERSAMNITLYLTIDLDQAFCGDMA